jgi:hypothetical protein
MPARIAFRARMVATFIALRWGNGSLTPASVDWHIATARVELANRYYRRANAV